MAKKQIFERRSEKLNEYLTQLDELLKKNRGTGTYEAYDVNPRAFRVGGRVVDPSGLGQDMMKDDVKYSAYEPTSIPMNAPLTQQGYSVGDFDTSEIDQQMAQMQDTSNKMSTQDFADFLNQITVSPIKQTDDGGVLYSDGTVKYQDGTTRQADQSEIPQPLFQLSNGAYMFDDGAIRKMDYSIGRAYRGVSGLSDLLFGRQQEVTQPYGNINPIEPTPGNVNLGTDFRTRDLPQDFRFTLPFDAKVVGVTYDDGTRFGDKSGHMGYGNSVYLQLPNGSIIHLSHLSDMENFGEGDVVKAFDYIGTPGQTGNTYGEHLDLEFLDPNLRPMNPNDFMLEAQGFIDFNAIDEAQTLNDEELARLPENEQQQVIATQESISRGLSMTPTWEQVQQWQQPEQAQQNPVQEYKPFQTIRDAASEAVQPLQPMSPQRQNLAQEVADFGQKNNIPEVYASEVVSGQLTPGEAVSYNIEKANLTPRIDTGASEALRGDWEGAKRNFQDTVSRIGKRVNKLPVQIANEIVKPAFADDGSQKPILETLGQNLKGAAQSVGQYVSDKVAQAGEGLEPLKEKVSNLFQKTPLMGLFQGQKQVGDAKGVSIIETGAGKSGTPSPDAFFKYGGADQYAQYLIDNAQEVKGGALDTSLFKPEFFQDPNRVANVFGETSLGGEATGKYKEYLGSKIKEGFEEPYKTERRQEGDTIYEYKIPVQEYFQNQYYKNLMAETPETLKTGFSFDQFQLPTVTRSASEFKGEVPTKTGGEPIFKSGVVDLFKRAGTKVGQLAGDVLKTPAKVYQPSQQSQKFAVPEALASVFKTQSPSFSIPATTKRVIEKIQPKAQPTLQDYLNMGKTAAQYYAETGQQSTADQFGGADKAVAAQQIQSIAPYTGMSSSQIANQLIQGAGVAPKVGANVQRQVAQEKAQGGIQLPTGALFDTKQPTAVPSAQVVQAPSTNRDSWLKTLFKRIF